MKEHDSDSVRRTGQGDMTAARTEAPSVVGMGGERDLRGWGMHPC